MNQPAPTQPLYKKPVSDTVPEHERRFEGDLYQRGELAKRLTDMLARVPDGAVLSIDSPWGEGKTWFGKRWRASLEDQGFRTAYIDCFQRDHIGDPFAMLAGELLELSRRGKSTAEIKLMEAGKKIGSALVPAATKFLVNAVGHLAIGNAGLADDIAKGLESMEEAGAVGLEQAVAKTLEGYEESKKSVEGFKKALEEMASESDKPIVIFLDELDRCRPDFAIHTIERVKHFFDVPGIVFVLLINRRQLAAAIRGLYGQDVDAEAYLAKFIQLSLSLPKKLSLERHGQDDNRKHVENELRRYGFGSGDGANAFASMMGVFGTLFELSLRDMERAVALYSFAQPLNSSSSFATWPIALKLAKPDLFRRLRNQEKSGHLEAYKLAARLKEQAPDASFVLELFEELHNSGSQAFEKSVSPEILQSIRQLNRFGDAKDFCNWIFERVDLSVSR